MHRLSPLALLLSLVLLGASLAGRPAAAQEQASGITVEAADIAPKPVEEPPAPRGPAPADKPDEAAPPDLPRQPLAVPPELAGERVQPELRIPEPLEVPAPIFSIDVTGNVRISTEEILKVVTSQVGGQYSEPQAARDRQAIVNLGWFQRVALDRESVEHGIRLTFRVVENPVIADIRFEGNRELTHEQLLAVLSTKPGQSYNAPMLARDAQAIEERYRREGFILAMVVSQGMSAEGVLTLTIAEGAIEEIRITGNTHTKTYAIRRYVRTQVGETYNDRKVARDVARLSALGWFETVRRDAEVGSEPGKVVVIITVVEKRRTGMASVGGGYSSVQGLVGFIDLTKGNLGGTGQVVTVRGEFGGRTSYELGYQNPWVMTPETRLTTGVYNRLILREAFVTDEGQRRTILYDERRQGGNLTLGRPLSDATTVFVGVRRDDVSISGLSAEEEPFLEGPAFEPRKVQSLTLAAVNDTRGDVYNPRWGSYQRVSAEFSGVFGGVDFNKYVSDTRRFFPAGKKNSLALRLLGGVVTGEPPYLEQFLIGGSESLRGYRTDRFVGTRMFVLNTEYRVPFTDNLLGVAFVDMGDAWGGSTGDIPGFEDISHSSFESHLGYGVGIRVRTPIGPLRLDLGFSSEGTETHFGVRHMF